MDVAAPPSVDAVLRSPGQPLDTSARAFFERRLGHDFGRVRVHTGAAAEQSARDVRAHAYTVGMNIVFGSGRFAPGTQEGRKLLGHELTHVVQQSGTRGERVQRQPVETTPSPATSEGPAIPAVVLYLPPAGVGLRVPVHPKAVTGIHDFSSDDGVPEGRATNRNSFRVGSYKVQQICAVDPMGAARVFLYYVTVEGGKTLAVGPESLPLFVMQHGGTITPRASNSDQLDLPKGPETSGLDAAPDAFDEEPQIYYLAPRLPAYDEVDPPPQPFRIDIYLMEPYLRRLPNGNLAVLYYMASRQMTEFGGKFRLEYVVGPRWLSEFRQNLDYYAGIAGLGFLGPGGSPPPEYAILSARAATGILHNDPERAHDWLKAWGAAVKDPSWWLSLGMGYAGAAEPMPEAQPPKLELLPGGRGAPTGTGVSAGPIVAPPPTVRAPMRSGGGATAAAVDINAEVAPAARPAVSPAPAPRTGPKSVLAVNPNPQPVARVSPPAPIASTAVISAVSRVAGQPAKWQPVMPTNLSAADKKLWQDCAEIKKSYDDLKAKVENLSASVDPLLDKVAANRATNQEWVDLCNRLNEQIKMAEKLHQGRTKYINTGCDKFDWFERGTTEAERRQRHEGAAAMLSNQIANLRKNVQKYCPALKPRRP